MTTFLPQGLRDDLAAAHRNRAKSKSRLRVVVEGEAFPILCFDNTQFSLDAARAPQLRGYVDIYDGACHLYRALIVASELEGAEMIFEFKRNTATADHAARDFEVDRAAPVALLEAF